VSVDADPRTHDLFTISPPPALDLLFVIDDSASMGAKQRDFASGFPGLLHALEIQPGQLPSLRLAAVTSDLGAGGADLPAASCRPAGDGGRFQVLDPASGASCGLPPGVGWIASDSAGTNLMPGHTLEEVFGCLVTRGTSGCGFGHQLEAVTVALTPRAERNPQNLGFLRPEAYLGIVLLTDRDDCSAQADAAPFFTDPPPPAFTDHGRCAWAGHLCNGALPPTTGAGLLLGQCQANPAPPAGTLIPVDQIVRDVKALKPGRDDRIFVGAVAGLTDDPDAFYRLIPNGGPYDVGPYCDSAHGAGTPALRIGSFVDSFPSATKASICADSYSPSLTAFGHALKKTIGALSCISAPVFDLDSQVVGVQGDCVVEVQTGGTATEVPACAPGAARPCWSLVTTPDCPNRYQVLVDRGGAALPPDLKVAASCRTCARPDDPRCRH
jgi:hypothetical protein